MEIAIAAGDLKTARAAADEAEQIVDSYKIGERRAAAFDATVHFARGQILLAEKDWDGAIAALKHARDEWQGVGAPVRDRPRARAALGTAYRRAGDEHGSTVELEAALATFERLGAAPEAARIKELLGRVETRRTFLFTDIVDSTRLLDTLGDDKWRRLLARHDELIREAIAESGGEVVKQTGDGFFASFESAKAAIEAAVAIQRALAARSSRPTCGSARTRAARSARRTSRPTTAARASTSRRASAPRRQPARSSSARRRSTASARRSASRSREPRTLKGVEQPVEVVAVDWR